MLLGRPNAGRGVETINDYDGFVSNFWRAISKDPNSVAAHANWPVNEVDLEARHIWLVNKKNELRVKLNDPDYFDAKIAGWWCWGACSWIGSGWCSGTGSWVWDGEKIVNRKSLPSIDSGGRGISRRLPSISSSGCGINRSMPSIGNSGRGINRKLPSIGGGGRAEFIAEWFNILYERLRDVRVVSGDWTRVCAESVTVTRGLLTGVFLDPPYNKGLMDYSSGGMGLGISDKVREWCVTNGGNKMLRIVIAGHDGEHDELIELGWKKHKWNARKGYAATDDAKKNTSSETVWSSPFCLDEKNNQKKLFHE